MKLKLLINYIGPSVHQYIANLLLYESAMAELEKIYIKLRSKVFAHHVLITRNQKIDESLDQYLQALHLISKTGFKPMTAEINLD